MSKGKIGVIGRTKMFELIRKVMHGSQYKDVEVVYLNGLFNNAFEEVKSANKIDIFVTGHAHSELVNAWFPDIPQRLIQPSPFDVILSIKKAASYDNTVHVINSYNLVELEFVKEILRPDIKLYQYKFSSEQELQNILKGVVKNNGKVVVGGSLMCEEAQKYGLNSFYYYSEEAIKLALNDAVNLVRIKLELKSKYKTLEKVIEFSDFGIIVVNNYREVEFINVPAINLLKNNLKNNAGKKIDEILPKHVISDLDKGKTVVSVNNIDFLFELSKNEDGSTVFRFQQVESVEKASYHIRQQMLLRPQVAKYTFNNIIGTQLQTIIEIAKSYAECSDANVLIIGETGTGKELFASGIHNASHRHKEPFVAINCAALPENLLESELFGYEEGSFTGAKKKGKRGLIELTHKGTLFLDEIGEMPTTLQAKLLRVLQEKEVLRIGGEVLIPVDLRVIAATNRRLEEIIHQGNFRDDLYYRLSTLVLEIPPLSERKEDLVELIDFFLHTKVTKVTLEVIKSVCYEFYKDYYWPGNIRELQNILERIITYLKHNDKMLQASFSAQDLSKDLIQFLNVLHRTKKVSNKPIHIIKDNNIKQKIYTPELIRTALDKSHGNKTKAAQILGISRSTLWRKLKDFTDTDDNEEKVIPT